MTVPPLRQIEERIDPTRARPVPFCRQSLRPEPDTSPRPLVLCVPARWLAKYQRTLSCSRCRIDARRKDLVNQFHLAYGVAFKISDVHDGHELSVLLLPHPVFRASAYLSFLAFLISR